MTEARPGKSRTSLVGFFGHTLIDDQEVRSGKSIQYSFEIVRKINGDRYVVQYFSAWDRQPTNLGVYAETFLTGPDVRLYANAALLAAGYEKSALHGCY